MFRDVPGCSGMFHVPGFIDGPFDFSQGQVTKNQPMAVPV